MEHVREILAVPLCTRASPIISNCMVCFATVTCDLLICKSRSDEKPDIITLTLTKGFVNVTRSVQPEWGSEHSGLLNAL